MSFKITFSLLLIISFTASTVFSQRASVLISNNSKNNRLDQLVVLSRSELTKRLAEKDIEDGITITDKNNNKLTVQLDDLDFDGDWDEALFLYSFKAREKILFNIFPGYLKDHTTTSRAHVRHRRKKADDSFGMALMVDSIPAGHPNTDFLKVKLPPFLTEGPAWENDRVGFRLYFDVRNGKDIWGKTTTKMMMDSVGVNPEVSYHHLASWGMDVYKVGTSLSAGALAINLKRPNKIDTLIRLGGQHMGRVVYEKISDGPLRARFRLKYPEWHYTSGASPLFLVEDISISAGQFYYESEVTFLNAPKEISLTTGFADIYKVPSGIIRDGSASAFYSYGLQSENNDNLGLAIIARSNEILDFKKTNSKFSDINDSYLLSFKSKRSPDINRFRFYACWSLSDARFKSIETFEDFLHEQIDNYSEDLKFKWLKKEPK